MKLKLTLITIVVALAQSVSLAQREPVNVVHNNVEKKSLPLQVLARSNAEIYENVVDGDKDTMGTKKIGVAKLYERFFVYDAPKWTSSKNPKEEDIANSAFLVGDKRGNVKGWIKGDRVLLWKHNMVVTFSPRAGGDEGRKPVILFKDRASVKKMSRTLNKADDRNAAADKVYKLIEAKVGGKLDGDALKAVDDEIESLGMSAIEPDMEVDMRKNTYLIPVMNFSEMEIDGENRFLLGVACATKNETPAPAKKPGGDKDGGNSQFGGTADPVPVKDLKVDITFVVDSTGSMGAYINRTLKNIRDTAEYLSTQKSIKDRIRFGLWAYRDSDGASGYVSKNFTPELQDAKSFEKTLSTVRAEGGGQDLPEELFLSVSDAIENTAWTKSSVQGAEDTGSIRFIVVMGDAPGVDGREFNDGRGSNAARESVTKMSAKALNDIARQNKATILAVHIHNQQVLDYLGASKYEEYRAWIEEQYRDLSLVPGLQGTSDSAYFYVGSEDEFAKTSKMISDQLIKLVEAASGSKADDFVAVVVDPGSEPEPEPGDNESENSRLIAAVARKAAMTWLGSRAGVEAPADVVAWIPDHDLTFPSIATVEPRVLMTKQELNLLSGNLQSVLEAMAERDPDDPESTQEAWEALMEVSGGAIVSGSVGDLLGLLPYDSEILSMDEDEFSSMGAEREGELIATLNNKIQYYNRITESDALWLVFDEEDEPGDHCFPIALEWLP